MYTAQQQKRYTLGAEMKSIEENMKKQEDAFNKQVKEHGFHRNSKQMIIVMIGKTGHGQSTLGNRICGDTSERGDKGPFVVSGKKYKAETTKVTSNISTVPFHNSSKNENEQSEEDNLLVVDTPGWGDVDEKNRELCYQYIRYLMPSL